MPRLAHEIAIAAPTTLVWERVADFGAAGDWAPEARDVHWTSDARSGVGCSRSVTGPDGVALEEIVTAWDDGRSLTFEIPGGVARIVEHLAETWSVRARGSESVVNVTMEYGARFGPLGAALAHLLIRPVLDKALRENLAGLKRFVEAAVPPPGV